MKTVHSNSYYMCGMVYNRESKGSWGAPKQSLSIPHKWEKAHPREHGLRQGRAFVLHQYLLNGQGRMIYGKRWEQLRGKILRRDGYMSKLSSRYGKRVPANVVHHILPAEFFPEYMWQMWNLITVTAGEHNRLHIRDTHKLSADGLSLARKTAVKQGLNLTEVMVRLNNDDEKKDQDA